MAVANDHVADDSNCFISVTCDPRRHGVGGALVVPIRVRVFVLVSTNSHPPRLARRRQVAPDP
eukprot:scaffold200687_cov23-Prasinocladus_malaysianus.AAC.1